MHPLLEAIHRADLAETRRLCEAHPAWVVGEHGFRPLEFAASKGHADIVECLLDHGTDPDASGQFGHDSPYNGLMRPIHSAAQEGHLAVVRLLLSRGAHVAGGNKYFTPLFLAADHGRKDVVKVLLKAGAKADVFVAAALNELGVLRKLLQADPSRARRRTEFGVTALMVAASHGHIAIAETLLAASADPLAQDHRRNHVLDYAAGVGYFDPTHVADAGQAKIAQQLIACGADVNARNTRGVRPLHRAARANRLTVATVLLDGGAEVDPHDVLGQTPLHRAVASPGATALVKLLLARGANPNARDKHQRRPLALARGAAMKSLLKRHGAR